MTLQIDLPDEPAVLKGEPALLARAIANLVSNAIKFSPQGGAVTVSLTREPGSFVVAVQDHGPGIAEADQPRLFEPFARLHEGQQARRKARAWGWCWCAPWPSGMAARPACAVRLARGRCSVSNCRWPERDGNYR
ncbi:hypothetical protein AU476_35220 [Cupriavidus sp. UYMSc13B]|nr:hypothetical protein AU476_35220 [Cupriavidus sp. UYMSc13B]